jgi:hypothetical protein
VKTAAHRRISTDDTTQNLAAADIGLKSEGRHWEFVKFTPIFDGACDECDRRDFRAISRNVTLQIGKFAIISLWRNCAAWSTF